MQFKLNAVGSCESPDRFFCFIGFCGKKINCIFVDCKSFPYKFKNAIVNCGPFYNRYILPEITTDFLFFFCALSLFKSNIFSLGKI